ncbi:MAG: hypothetical protein HC938_03790 [Nitrospira sp.]|nr:hypothetical protein [Nitrospira sp.]
MPVIAEDESKYMTSKSSAKERLVQTFKFLKELNELRNPVPRDVSGADVMRIDTWPSHPCVQVRRGDRTEDDVTDTAELEMEPLIRIQRARLTPCPPLPAILDGWLKPGWQSVDAQVQVLESRNFPGKDRQSNTAAFTDDRKRIDAFTEWTGVRATWAEAERVAIAAQVSCSSECTHCGP